MAPTEHNPTLNRAVREGAQREDGVDGAEGACCSVPATPVHIVDPSQASELRGQKAVDADSDPITKKGFVVGGDGVVTGLG